MSDADVLRAARARIETPERWNRGALARGPRGHLTSPVWREAVSWCALGAIAAQDVSVFDEDAEEIGPARWLRKALPFSGRGVASFNDDPATTHPDVLALFDRAIALAEAEGRR